MNVPLSNIIDNLIYVYILHLFHSILTVPLRGKKTFKIEVETRRRITRFFANVISINFPFFFFFLNSLTTNLEQEFRLWRRGG